MLGPGLIVLDALGLRMEDDGLLGPNLVLGALGPCLEEVGLLGPGLVDALGLGLEDVGLLFGLAWMMSVRLVPASYLTPSVLVWRKSALYVPHSSWRPAPSALYASCHLRHALTLRALGLVLPVPPRAPALVLALPPRAPGIVLALVQVVEWVPFRDDELGRPGLNVGLMLIVLVPVVSQLLGVQDVRACEWLRCGTSFTCKRLYCAVVVGLRQPGIG